jgi:hypothetical protein
VLNAGAAGGAGEHRDVLLRDLAAGERLVRDGEVAQLAGDTDQLRGLPRVPVQLVAQPGRGAAMVVEFVALCGVEFADGVDEVGVQLGDLAVQCAHPLTQLSNRRAHAPDSRVVHRHF